MTSQVRRNMTSKEWLESLQEFPGFPRLVLGWPLREYGITMDEDQAYEEYLDEHDRDPEDTPGAMNSDDSYRPYTRDEWQEKVRQPQLEDTQETGLGFSWDDCDLCRSSLGGERYAATALPENPAENSDYVPLSVCQDCLMFLANGDVPDWLEDD